MKISVEAVFDDEAKVWVGTAADNIGLVTEAETIDELEQKLALLAPDLLGEESGPFDIELIARRTQHAAAQ